MKNLTSVSKAVWRNDCGASLVEFTVIMPVLFLLTLGTVDLGYVLYDYDLASKAVYAGAHRAIVSDPVASDITSYVWTATDIGTNCSSAVSSSGSTGVCSSYEKTTTCTYASGTGTCTNNHTFSPTAFTTIVDKMQTTYGCTAGSATCPLQPSNVSITYAVTGTLGFVGQPNGLPMNVTVAIACMYHTFYFVGALLGWTYTAPAGCTGTPTGWAIPTYSTTLTSEDMVTN